jgi:hypothetical protein
MTPSGPNPIVRGGTLFHKPSRSLMRRALVCHSSEWRVPQETSKANQSRFPVVFIVCRKQTGKEIEGSFVIQPEYLVDVATIVPVPFVRSRHSMKTGSLTSFQSAPAMVSRRLGLGSSSNIVRRSGAAEESRRARLRCRGTSSLPAYVWDRLRWPDRQAEAVELWRE